MKNSRFTIKEGKKGDSTTGDDQTIALYGAAFPFCEMDFNPLIYHDFHWESGELGYSHLLFESRVHLIGLLHGAIIVNRFMLFSVGIRVPQTGRHVQCTGSQVATPSF